MNIADIDFEPGIRVWIDRIEQLAPTLPDLASADPAVQRVAARELSDLLAVDCTLPIPDGVELDDLVLGGRPARRYRPAGVEGPMPTQLWLHGGGFFAGTIDEVLNDRLSARRALDSGVQIVSLEYRLAPEAHYPAQIEDALGALEALDADADRLGVDTSRLGIGGNSAGAAIAASTALHARDAGVELLHVTLEVPPTAMPPVGDSAVEFATGFGLDGVEQIIHLYAGPDGPADGYIAPLDVADLTELPPHLILVAEYDPLRDSGTQYAERLGAAGVDVDLYFGPGHLHGSPGQTAVSPAAVEFQREHSQRLAAAYRVR
ncbi:alpha/beta hydrolase fold domain-containing protein [Schumannella soli]|uniref:Alpha/beta hydrolase n=1 Tax=Schumannella soli TaxID=2590779 RepID=A0A506Y7H5_9MICO|nr:alpha/beta hydrolase fold domain-containing protein [Schumannella soli]TPW77470.1 alpha/beta hydrolase [Schumannella soli]